MNRENLLAREDKLDVFNSMYLKKDGNEGMQLHMMPTLISIALWLVSSLYN